MKGDNYKQRQISYYRNKWRNSRSMPRSPVINFFSTVALDKIVHFFPLSFKGKKVLIACGGGDGFEILKMEKLGGNLTVTDISQDALDEIGKKHPLCQLKVADVEILPFKDNSFDIGLVKDGLHHLKDPKKGIKELFRVCREAVLVIDFQETFLTHLAKVFGFSPEFEEAGNRNFHFKKKDLEKLFKKIGARRYKVGSLLLDARLFRSRIFETNFGFVVFKLIFYVVNLFFSRWGNVLMIVIIKNEAK